VNPAARVAELERAWSLSAGHADAHSWVAQARLADGANCSGAALAPPPGLAV